MMNNSSNRDRLTYLPQYNNPTQWRLSRPLRIGIVPSEPPFMFDCFTSTLSLTPIPIDCPMPGMAVEIMHFLLKSLNFEYTLVPLNVTQDGYGRPGPNGT